MEEISVSPDKDTGAAKVSETSAKLSPGKSGEFCLMCGADIETMFVPGWNGNKFCRDCYYPSGKTKLLNAEIDRILKADCTAWDELRGRIAELETALAEETRLKCEYFAQWQQARRERDQFAAQVELAIQSLTAAASALREEKRLGTATMIDLRIAQITPAAAQPSMYPWMEGEDTPAAALEERDLAVRKETAKWCVERIRTEKHWLDGLKAIRREFGLEGK